ncbi:MAG TPA: hypothetical protein VET26_12395 [Candidatus Sulfotelmatobacter sp.]|nr:hypothetical protein [Candidatus Sulfotelmatobacter sp.]
MIEYAKPTAPEVRWLVHARIDQLLAGARDWRSTGGLVTRYRGIDEGKRSDGPIPKECVSPHGK